MKRLALGALFFVLATSLSAAATTLPGNASSLTEAHDDWIVRCAVANDLVSCAAQQEQTSAQTKQRILGIEVDTAGGKSMGTLVMPFGLQLSKGVILKIGDKLTSQALPFQTCLPTGCVVPFEIGKEWEAAMRSGDTLAVTASGVNGQDARFAVSLKGFSSAIDRISELTK
jgi:invasion protein IalB